MSGYGTFETCRPAVTMSAPEGRPEVMGRPANAYFGVFLGVMADSCFQDHCSTLRSRLRSISRACKHVARMHGAVLRLSRADKLRSVSSVPAGLSGGRHAINCVWGTPDTHANIGVNRKPSRVLACAAFSRLARISYRLRPNNRGNLDRTAR